MVLPSIWLHATSVVGLALALAPYISQERWMLELLSHFRVQMGIACLALVLLEALFGQPAYAVVAGLAAGLNWAPVLPFLLGRDRHGSAERIRLALFNVRMRNRDFDRTINYLRELNPDIVALVETDGEWIEAMAPLESMFPFQFSLPHPNSYGLTVLSRHPLISKQAHQLPSGGAPVLYAGVEIAGRTCGLLLAHIPPPLNPAGRRDRDLKLMELASLASTLSPISLLLGDFNITPWARTMGKLKALADLRDLRETTQGLQATWPAQAWAIRIPIDQVLARPGINLLSAAVGPRLGSDHLPLLAEFEIGQSG